MAFRHATREDHAAAEESASPAQLIRNAVTGADDPDSSLLFLPFLTILWSVYLCSRHWGSARATRKC